MNGETRKNSVLKGPFMLVTTRPGRETTALEEALDAILPIDVDAKEIDITRKGVVLIRLSSMNKLSDAISALRKRITSTIFHIIPLDILVFKKDLYFIKRLLTDLCRDRLHGASFRVRCKGSFQELNVRPSVLERLLGEHILRSLSHLNVKVNLEAPDFIVIVYELNNALGIGVFPSHMVIRKRTRWG